MPESTGDFGQVLEVVVAAAHGSSAGVADTVNDDGKDLEGAKIVSDIGCVKKSSAETSG